LFALFSFPFLLGFAAVSFDTPGFFPQRNLIRSRSALWIASGLFLLAIGVMLLLPSYSDLWRQNIHIRQSLNVETGSAEIHIGSNEYLRNLAVHWDSKDTAISTWDRDILLKQWTMHPQDWMTVENTNTVEHHDSTTGYSILLHIYSRYRPYALTVTYSAGKHLIANVASPYLSEITGHSVSVQWKTFQDSSIVLPIQFQVSGNDRITQTIEASYIEMLDPVTIRNQWSNSVPNTVIRSVTQIK
jgi:hypothetical protein